MTGSLYDLLDPYGAADPVDGAGWAAQSHRQMVEQVAPRWQAAWLDPDLAEAGDLAAAQAAMALALAALSRPQWRIALEQRAQEGLSWLCDGDQDAPSDPSAIAPEEVLREGIVARVYDAYAARITAASRPSVPPAELRAVRAQRERALRTALREAGLLPVSKPSRRRGRKLAAVRRFTGYAAGAAVVPAVAAAVAYTARALGRPTPVSTWLCRAPATIWVCIAVIVLSIAGWRAASPRPAADDHGGPSRRRPWAIRVPVVCGAGVAVATAPAIGLPLVLLTALVSMLKLRHRFAGDPTTAAQGARPGSALPPSPTALPSRTRLGDSAHDLCSATAILRSVAARAELPQRRAPLQDMATAALIAEAWSAACDEPDWQKCALYGPQATRILGRAVALSVGYRPSTRRSDVDGRGRPPAWAAAEARAMRAWVRGLVPADEAAVALHLASAQLWPEDGPGVPPAIVDRLGSLAGALSLEARRR